MSKASEKKAAEAKLKADEAARADGQAKVDDALDFDDSEEETQDQEGKEDDAEEEQEEEKDEPAPKEKLKASEAKGKAKGSNLPEKPIFIHKIKDDKLKSLLEEVGVGHHRLVGYVNQNDILFPVGFKTRHFHIGWKGNVVMNKCPKCGFRNSAEQAIKGECGNLHSKMNDGEPCGFSAVAELDEIDKA